VIGKPYFEKHGWVYRRGAEFYRTKFENEDSHSYVELIARPGFVKCGDDNGENFGTVAPWIQAIVQAMQIEQAVPSPPRPIQRKSNREDSNMDCSTDPGPTLTPPGSYNEESDTA